MILRIHKEGKGILLTTVALFAVIIAVIGYFAPGFVFGVSIVLILLFLAILQFFRNPVREIHVANNNIVYAPADGKIVVIEETQETEYFQAPKIQVSIFMSPTNVHVNRNPISGTVNYFKYHPGN